MGPRPQAATGDGYLGVFSFGEESEQVGARVTRVMEESPAQKAGLEAGDVIAAINNKAIHSGEELREESRNFKVGEKVKVKFIRDGKNKEVELTAAQRPAGGPFGGGRGGGDPNRPFGATLGGQMENAQARARRRRLPVRRHLQVDRRRRLLDAHQQLESPSHVLQPDPRRSQR